MISIVIPIFNQHDMSIECINAVRECTQGGFEFVLIDNGSNPPFKAPFTGFNETILIRNEENKGFPVAVNQGIRAARGEIIILLNNDVIVTPGWTERLLPHLDEFSIVGAVTNYCAGVQKVDVPVYMDKKGLYEVAQTWAEEYSGAIEEVSWVIGFCVVFRKSFFDEIGPFDESLWPCCGEEVDFCLRAKKAGHRIGIAHEVYVHHEGSVTFAEMDKSKQLNYTEICNRNDEYLIKKWGKNVYIPGNNRIIQEIEKTIPEIVLDEAIRLNLGCGYRKLEGYVNIDNRQEIEPDLLCDILDGLPYEDNSIDKVRAFDFLEHIPIGKTVDIITEIWRVLKPDGRFESFTPDAETGQGAFQDPNHLSFWVENSWLYFSDKASRDLYGIKADFEIESIKRVETGSRVFHLHVIAKARK